MKKFFLSAVVIGAFVVYAVFQRKNATSLPAESVSLPPPTISKNTEIPSASGTPSNYSRIISNSSTTPIVSGGFKNGTYTGASIDALYGSLQVQAIIKNGQLADIKFLSYPTDRSHSMMINNQAAPLLKNEAITSQSANVDIISGATATSEAFIQSLQSALNQAA